MVELDELEETRDMASYAVEEVNALAQLAVRIGRQLTERRAQGGIDAAIAYVEDLEALVDYAASAERIVASHDPRLSLSLGGFRLRLFQVVDAISDAFDNDDLRLAAALFGRRLAPALLDYHSIAEAVSSQLGVDVHAA